MHRCRTADLVIGSRYVPGGGTENWNARRRFISRCGNTYISLFLGSTIHDWTGGFRCYRRDLLTQMNLATVRAKGYIFQVEWPGGPCSWVRMWMNYPSAFAIALKAKASSAGNPSRKH